MRSKGNSLETNSRIISYVGYRAETACKDHESCIPVLGSYEMGFGLNWADPGHL